MDKVYVVWERESYSEYGVVLITAQEDEAKKLSGEKTPNKWKTKKNNGTNRWYEELYLEKQYNLFGDE